MAATVTDLASATRAYREVGASAAWSVSSYKGSFGVDHLRDNDLTTYWQSDAVQPHQVNIQFRTPVRLACVAVYLDCRIDESYTPNKIVLRAGTTFHDLQDVGLMDMADVAGWCLIPVADARQRAVHAHILQVTVVSNLQNGRDTHIRQIKVYAPLANPLDPIARPFTSAIFRQQDLLR